MSKEHEKIFSEFSVKIFNSILEMENYGNNTKDIKINMPLYFLEILKKELETTTGSKFIRNNLPFNLYGIEVFPNSHDNCVYIYNEKTAGLIGNNFIKIEL